MPLPEPCRSGETWVPALSLLCWPQEGRAALVEAGGGGGGGGAAGAPPRSLKRNWEEEGGVLLRGSSLGGGPGRMQYDQRCPQALGLSHFCFLCVLI